MTASPAFERLLSVTSQAKQIDKFIGDAFDWWKHTSDSLEIRISEELKELFLLIEKLTESPGPDLTTKVSDLISASLKDTSVLLEHYEQKNQIEKQKNAGALLALLDMFQEDYSTYTRELEQSILQSESSKNADPNNESKTSSKTPEFIKLTLDSAGRRVEEIQRALYQIGFFRNTIDGHYGLATQIAVKGFQTDYELPITGEVDEKTYSEILKIVSLRLQEKSANTSKAPTETEENMGHSLFGYDKLIKRGNEITGIKGNDVPELRIGMDVVLLGDSRGYVPSLFKPGEIATITEFTKPFEAGESDHIIHVRNSRHSGWVKPSNIDKNAIRSKQPQPRAKYFNKFSLSIISSDSVNEKLHDDLNITDDVTALASVIAYKKVTPPLAIGLFGNWGSGKSFFMKMLEEQIRTFSGKETGEYYKNIVHIKFNSWHYSDTNLWASLVTKIFDELNKNGKNDPDRLEKLYSELDTIKEIFKETQQKHEKIDNEIKTLVEKNTTLDADLAKSAGELKNVSPEEVIKEVFEMDVVKKEIKEWAGSMPAKALQSVNDIDHAIADLGDTGKRFLDSLKMIYSFRHGNVKYVLLSALLVIAVCTGISYLVTNGNPAIFGKVATILSVIAAGTQQLVQYILPYKKGIDTTHNHLLEIKKTVENLKQEKLNEFSAEQEQIKREIEVKKEEKRKNEEKLVALTEERATIEKELLDIKTGKRLASFIESRVMDQRYLNSLGIVSWIRKDFETLDQLLKDQSKSNTEETEAQKQLKAVMQIDRIVLYIDDLDRCNEDIVVKVLESIHLLLAFELFVVVVGVDPRWMYNALTTKFKNLLTHSENEQRTKGEKQNGKPVDETDNDNCASAYDYLEKIFQIPFVLKPIDKPGRDRMIATQFVEDTRKDNGSDNKDSAKGSNGKETPPPGAGIHDQAGVSKDLKDKNDKQARLELHATEKLKISREEIDFMTSVSELIGDTPRTIKRFTNIYRIIRTHAKLEIHGDEMETYCAVMILLGIITGLPRESNKIFSLLLKSKKNTLGEVIGENAWIPADIKNSMNLKFKSGNNAEKQVGQIPLSILKVNIELIMRFSFRTHDLTEDIAITQEQEAKQQV